MTSFPKTLAALREAEREQGPGCNCSDANSWAIGDALIEECGVDPVWDVDEEFCPCEFKGGLKIREAADWLEERGMSNLASFSSDFPCELLAYRQVSERFPPETRRMNITYVAHIECGSPEEAALRSRQLAPGEVLCTVSEDAEAWGRYGPC
jgi:hypothetical protein